MCIDKVIIVGNRYSEKRLSQLLNVLIKSVRLAYVNCWMCLFGKEWEEEYWIIQKCKNIKRAMCYRANIMGWILGNRNF